VPCDGHSVTSRLSPQCPLNRDTDDRSCSARLSAWRVFNRKGWICRQSLCSPETIGTYIYIVLLQCGVCGNGVVAKYSGVSVPNWISGLGVGDSRLIEVWPKRAQIEAPQHLPSNVTNYYLQGVENLSRKNFDAAGTMFGKALDAGLRKLHPEGKGTLERRIDNLPDTIGIAPAMKEWAHEIRRLRNDAAHEEEPFLLDEARALQSFTELF
jgi:hypothetical protein